MIINIRPKRESRWYFVLITCNRLSFSSAGRSMYDVFVLLIVQIFDCTFFNMLSISGGKEAFLFWKWQWQAKKEKKWKMKWRVFNQKKSYDDKYIYNPLLKYTLSIGLPFLSFMLWNCGSNLLVDNSACWGKMAMATGNPIQSIEAITTTQHMNEKSSRTQFCWCFEFWISLHKLGTFHPWHDHRRKGKHRQWKHGSCQANLS